MAALIRIPSTVVPDCCQICTNNREDIHPHPVFFDHVKVAGVWERIKSLFVQHTATTEKGIGHYLCEPCLLRYIHEKAETTTPPCPTCQELLDVSSIQPPKSFQETAAKIGELVVANGKKLAWRIGLTLTNGAIFSLILAVPATGVGLIAFGLGVPLRVSLQACVLGIPASSTLSFLSMAFVEPILFIGEKSIAWIKPNAKLKKYLLVFLAALAFAIFFGCSFLATRMVQRKFLAHIGSSLSQPIFHQLQTGILRPIDALKLGFSSEVFVNGCIGFTTLGSICFSLVLGKVRIIENWYNRHRP